MSHQVKHEAKLKFISYLIDFVIVMNLKHFWNLPIIGILFHFINRLNKKRPHWAVFKNNPIYNQNQGSTIVNMVCIGFDASAFIQATAAHPPGNGI
jgi:hypothetical protein